MGVTEVELTGHSGPEGLVAAERAVPGRVLGSVCSRDSPEIRDKYFLFSKLFPVANSNSSKSCSSSLSQIL